MYKEILHNGKEIGGMWLTLRGNIQSIEKIEINPEYRNKGYARVAMQEIIINADANDITLALTPSSDFGAKKTKLIDFYKSLGFVPNTGRNKNYETKHGMIRYPIGKSDLKEIIEFFVQKALTEKMSKSQNLKRDREDI